MWRDCRRDEGLAVRDAGRTDAEVRSSTSAGETRADSIIFDHTLKLAVVT